MNTEAHRKTPAVAVFDGRAGPVRRVDYLRGTARDETQTLVTAQAYDVAGRIVDQWDPRFHGTETVSLHSIYSLSGTPLRTENIDAGLRCELPGLAGQRLHSWDPRGSEQQTEYDSQLRPTRIRERDHDEAWATVGLLRYASRSTEDALHNRCGQLVEHYDTAGLVTVDDFSLAGLPLDQGQRFLDTLMLPDWADDEAGREDLLEPARYDTRWRYDAVGDALGQTDAKGHNQHIELDVAGQPKSVHLQWSDSPTAELIAHEFQYSAAGQRQAYTAGNGIITTFFYDPADGRLTELKATKGSDIHQHLSYLYDLVGNVTSITDHTHVVRYHANQRSEGARTFLYDTLYRLESATGLEMSGAGTHPGLPGLVPPSDLTLRTPYTQRYEYDHGGNLQKLIHSSAAPGQAHTLRLTMDPSSNRCRQWQKGEASHGDNLDFDAGGNQLSLPFSGHHLTWNRRSQLQKVTQVQRENAEDDAEHYTYDAQGSRMRKRQNTQAASVVHVRDVRYLPGLQIRTLDDSEELHVCTMQGPASNVRGLYWVKRRPAEIDQGQLRYSLEDHLGSLVKELDQNALLISHEGYYPFGGTAWWAADLQVQASYKTVRYSGKERDASGLYYYGFRYYAPWMMRWINPDPAGPVDGLNLYAMVGNNPIRYSDNLGLIKIKGEQLMNKMSPRTQHIIGGGDAPFNESQIKGSNAKKLKAREEHYEKHPEAQLFSKSGRDVLSAHAGFEIPSSDPEEPHYLTDLYNIPLPGSLELMSEGVQVSRGPVQNSQEDFLTSGGIFQFGDVTRYEAFVENKLIETFNDAKRPMKLYKGSNSAPTNLTGIEHEAPVLHPLVKQRLENHISAGNNYLPKAAGLPGLHAESIGANVALNIQQSMTGVADPSQILVITQKIAGSKNGLGRGFPACFNCTNILRGPSDAADDLPKFDIVTEWVPTTHSQWNDLARPYIN
ncbi:RHS repeat-associated core domain-containing protein [Pseudomonas sp. D1-1]|uniref:RHS repeat-associated core domain-containing protein n=1 Tax=Pseudomonas sp. D1-1 TaxID=1040793 RepID=UPI003DA86EED